MEAKKGSEILNDVGYSKKFLTSARELTAAIIGDLITLSGDDCESYRYGSKEVSCKCGYVRTGSALIEEAGSVSKSISNSLVAIHFILSELDRLVCRARLPELPSGELSELEAMGRDLSEGFAKHAAFSLKYGSRPLQGELVEIEFSDGDLGKISFPSKVLSPLILGPLSFLTREELVKTEITISTTRMQLEEYDRELESFSKSLVEREAQVEVKIQNEAASFTSPSELALIVEKLGITPRAA
jgi:hypothetical protein